MPYEIQQRKGNILCLYLLSTLVRLLKCLLIFFSGLLFKKLDKRLERSMLHSYRKVCSWYLEDTTWSRKPVRTVFLEPAQPFLKFLLVHAKFLYSWTLLLIIWHLNLLYELKDLIAQVSSESDPVSFLPKVVALLFLQVCLKLNIFFLSWKSKSGFLCL